MKFQIGTFALNSLEKTLGDLCCGKRALEGVWSKEPDGWLGHGFLSYTQPSERWASRTSGGYTGSPS